MGNAHLVVLLVFSFVARGMSATQPSGAPQVEKVDAISVSSQLKTTLSKLYPIERWTMSTKADAGYPFAPRFCWEFFRADSETLDRLSKAIRNYSGVVGWVFGPPLTNNGTCLVAAKRGVDEFVGYPPLNRAMEQPSGPTEEFIDQALSDIPNLCSHLERYLGLEQLPAKSFDPGLIAPPDPPSLDSVSIDFVERGMHVAWIVYGGSVENREGGGPSSSDRRMLHFSVTTKEWREIEAEILQGIPANRAARSASNSFPLLSRIEESESVYFRGTEVAALRQECLRARATALTPLAIRGLDKLILLCNWAKHGAGDLLLRAP
jgi:hypothetical protein